MKTTITIPNLVEGHPFRQWQTWKVPNTDFTVIGYSRSGDKTFFHIPQLDIALDAALAEGRRASRIFLSHTHNDHIADIEYLTYKNEVQIYLPKSSLAYLEDYIPARIALNRSIDYDSTLRGTYELIGVEKGNIFYFAKNDKYRVEVLQTVHSIASVGYGFAEKKTRLKPAFEELKQIYLAKNDMQTFGKLLAEKRKIEEVNETYYEPFLVYTGDTTEKVFELNPSIFDYVNIIMECTFFAPEHLSYAKERAHSHWQNIKPFVLANPHTHFVLIHFSLRYSDTEILAFFEKELAEIDNVQVWVSENPFLQPQHQKH